MTIQMELALDEFRRLLLANLGDRILIESERIRLLHQHYLLFSRWNRVMNLSSIREARMIVQKHYCESLFLGAHLPEGAFSVLDVGSGAGFPGIPVGILRPELEITLAESRKRKAAFLKEASRGLPNIKVYSGRAEELGQKYEWVIARAVRWSCIKELALRLGSGVAVLTGKKTLGEIINSREISWGEPVELPWASESVLVMGRVPRET
mgnify:CR=1 FL=1